MCIFTASQTVKYAKKNRITVSTYTVTVPSVNATEITSVEHGGMMEYAN